MSNTQIPPSENPDSNDVLPSKEPEERTKSLTKITPSSQKSSSHRCSAVEIKISENEVPVAKVQTEQTTPVGVEPNRPTSEHPKPSPKTKPDTVTNQDEEPPSLPLLSSNSKSSASPSQSSGGTNVPKKTKFIEVKSAPKSDSEKPAVLPKTTQSTKSGEQDKKSTKTNPNNASEAPSSKPEVIAAPKSDDSKKPDEKKPADVLAAKPKLMVAKKWGAAIDKTVAAEVAPLKKRRRGSKEIEIDPFLAKYATITTGRRYTIKEKEEAGDDDDDYEEPCCCDLSWCTWEYFKDYVIDPADPSWFYWSLLASIATFYNLVVVFLRAVFTDFNNPDWHTTWFCFDYLADFITILDMLLRCRLGFLEQGVLNTTKMRLVKMYVKSYRFPLDVISVLPFDLVYLVVGVNTLLRLNRLLRVWRINEFYNDSETRTSFPNLFRMVFLIINICLMIHFNACIYFSMSRFLGFGNDDWAFNPSRPGFDSIAMTYSYCFYWSMLTLTAIGDTEPPVSLAATLYCIIVTLCGVLIFATIFGNVGAMINQMNASRQEFQQNVDSVKRYMDIRKVSPVLQDRVIQWFAYTWNNKQSVDDKAALNILPDKLKTEIAIQVHLDTLKRVAIFKDCEPGLLQELVLKLRLQVFSPGDYICRKGDIGKEMYIIKRGKLEVVSPDGKIVFVTMQDGAVFGEISILNIAGNKTGNRRTASVRSVGYSDLFCLSKDDLWDALKEYPDARAMLWEKGKQMLRKDNLLDEEAARLKELADMSLETKIDNINAMMEKMGKQITGLMSNLNDVQKHMGIEIEKPEKIAVEAKKEH